MHLLLRLLLNALAVLLVAHVVPGISVNNFGTALLVALVLGILNAILRPILLLLTLPINILTLGLFTFVLNAFLLWLVGAVVKGFAIESFTAAFLGALVLWAISWATNLLLKK